MVNSKPRTALFVIPGESLDTPSPQGLLSHKFDYIYDEFRKNNWQTIILTDVHTKLNRSRSKYRLSSAWLNFIFNVLLIAITKPLAILRSGDLLSYLNQSALQRTYKSILSRFLPDVVLTIGASEVLVKACREAGISTVEIQHGMFEKSDLEIYWPRGIYPESFLTWDARSGRIALEHGFKPWVLGHPDEFLRTWEKSSSKKLGDFVCVSLGYNSEDSEDPWGCFPRRLTSAMDHLLDSNISLLIRIHPVMAARANRAKQIEKWIGQRFAGVRIDNPTRIPLSSTIGSSFCNLTVLSATWFDFALAGRPSAVMDKAAASRYQTLSSEIEIWESQNFPVAHVNSNDELSVFAESARNTLENPKILARDSAVNFINALEPAASGNLMGER